ncbi:sulfotransferase family protein [Occallatibacter savannae]|uniref:sulfotransferase family protein n=1 Tax=Occallatibacter savannae TaxID=1002691 RepID=UPI00194E3D23|nr:sulfotransferase [Occallatibacter savannae]
MTKYLTARCAVLKFCSENRSFIQTHGKLRAPFIITGLPRTGSTLLQRLMAEDPDARSPLTFEMESPLPPMSQDGDPLTDPRIARSGDALKLLARIAPGFLEKLAESHLWSATEFEESYIYMLAHNGVSVMSAPDAGEDYIRVQRQGCYHAPVLRYERMFFTMLDAYRPAKSHWVFKAPNYAPALPWMAKEYQDARIVLTHRNPLIVVPSVCRLMESWCIAFTRDGFFDKHRFAKIVSEIWEATLSVPLQYRRDNPDKSRRIFDCMYDDLFADPIAMVKRIYSWFDLEVTPKFEQRMRAYLDNNRQGKYGRHSYSLQEYGLDAEHLLESNYEYMQRYGFTIEEVGRSKRATSLR